MTNARDMAYPCQNRWDAGNEAMDLYDDARGLTKREYFAVMAMQGLIATGESIPERLVAPGLTEMQVDVERAVEYADALIAALNTEAK